MTPTPDQLATFRHDLTRVEFALETARAARQHSFQTEAFEAESRARDTLAQLVDVLDAWIDDTVRSTVDAAVEVAVAAHESPPQPTAAEVEAEAALLGIGMVRHTTSFVHLVEPAESLASLPDLDVIASIVEHAQDESLADDEPSPTTAALLPPEPAPPTAPGSVVDGKWGIYEGQVKVLRGNKFIRCPEFTCSVRVPLDPDDDTEADVAHALATHRPACLAKREAPPRPSKKRAGRA